jgi:hypothetical protein
MDVRNGAASATAETVNRGRDVEQLGWRLDASDSRPQSTAQYLPLQPRRTSVRAIARTKRNNDDYFLTGRPSRNREQWEREAERLHVDWPAVVELALDIIRSHCFESGFVCACREDDERREPASPRRPTPRSTPQTTIEAILYCVGERGSAALKEPANIERLRQCDKAARAEIDRRMPAYEGAR